MAIAKYTNLYQLVYTISVKNIKVKYKNSILGFVWSMLHPLAYLVIFIFVFSTAFAGMDRYPLYALIGLVFWTYFNNSINQIVNAIVHNASIIKTIALPNILFPMSASFSELITMMLSLVPFFLLMVFFGLQIGWVTLLIIPAIIIFSLFTFGLGVFMCTFNVFFRDVGILWGTLAPALFYFTPIAYSSTLIPAQYLLFLKFNPLYHYIQLMRDILYFNQVPHVQTWLITGCMSAVTFVVGVWVFNKFKRGFVSNL
jgi:ABC-type polysaccharide/polyol phosphate export permease